MNNNKYTLRWGEQSILWHGGLWVNQRIKHFAEKNHMMIFIKTLIESEDVIVDSIRWVGLVKREIVEYNGDIGAYQMFTVDVEKGEYKYYKNNKKENK